MDPEFLQQLAVNDYNILEYVPESFLDNETLMMPIAKKHRQALKYIGKELESHKPFFNELYKTHSSHVYTYANDAIRKSLGYLMQLTLGTPERRRRDSSSSTPVPAAMADDAVADAAGEATTLLPPKERVQSSVWARTAPARAPATLAAVAVAPAEPVTSADPAAIGIVAAVVETETGTAPAPTAEVRWVRATTAQATAATSVTEDATP